MKHDWVRAAGGGIDTFAFNPVDPHNGPRCARCGEGFCHHCEPECYRYECSGDIARAFHESYERQAPEYGYKTREASAVPWEDVPEANKALMVAVVDDLLARGVIGRGHA